MPQTWSGAAIYRPAMYRDFQVRLFVQSATLDYKLAKKNSIHTYMHACMHTHVYVSGEQYCLVYCCRLSLCTFT